ncbi:hypothetical protein BD560DRAFT_412695 [Blakeslea trispora]|nr:hypothetical protein BD560DRAFT_412695 [Blakeslea trispora]
MIYKDQRIEPSKYAIINWIGLSEFVPERAVTSHWFSSKVFLVIRLILTLYSTVVLWTDIGITRSGYFFMFFTSFTFIGLHAYLVTSCVHHIRYLMNKNMDFMLNQPAILNYLYMYLYSTVITFNIVTPVVYWALLNSTSTARTPVEVWLNVSVHGVSFFLMIFDVIMNRMKTPIRMVIFPLITIIGFMLFSFVVYACNGFWIYPFLDWSQGGIAAVWYIMVGVICVLGYFIQCAIHWLRDFVARKLGKTTTQELDEKAEPAYKMEESETV